MGEVLLDLVLFALVLIVVGAIMTVADKFVLWSYW